MKYNFKRSTKGRKLNFYIRIPLCVVWRVLKLEIVGHPTHIIISVHTRNYIRYVFAFAPTSIHYIICI